MKRTMKWIFVGLIGILILFVWLGFFFPNPSRNAAQFSVEKLIYLWFPRIFIPFFYGLIMFLFYTKNRKLAQNIGVLIATLFVCLVIAILVIYLFKNAASRRLISKQYHPYLQLKPPPDDSIHFPDDDESIKIFCLGGSTTEFKDTKGVGWPDRLETELRNTSNSDSIYVYNFGKQWYTTLHSLINFETNLRHHKPDVIIFMHNINDLLHNADFSYLSIASFRQDYGHFLGPLARIIKYKSSTQLSPFWRKFRSIWYNEYLDAITFEQDSFPGLEPYTRNINTLIDLALIDSIKFILLTEPNIFSDNMGQEVKNACLMVNYEAIGKAKRWGFHTSYLGMLQYNERLKEIAEDRNVYFIDLERYIPKSLTFFTDEVHYTDTTFNIISKILAEKIVRLKVIK